MRFRQVHLDFHTSEHIPGIGTQFSKQQFQEMLTRGHVDSITVFAKCHHGWAYFPSEVNDQHPNLDFDLLGAQIEAAHEINVKTPVYISVGFEEKMARIHPEWLMRDEKDRTNWVDGFMVPGWHQFCLNTPYLDHVIAQTEEVVRKYDADGIFLDIVGVRKCYCPTCLNQLLAEGKDPFNEKHVAEQGERVYANYAKRIREAIQAIKPDMPVTQNSGHFPHGRRDLIDVNTHLELESLPTAGWGYDHFPLSARYVQPLGVDFLGMTGKFHKFWGEFGGYKHPNALRYETALSLAHGAHCSIGDHLHPEGLMDPATYDLIGAAYSEVEAKEAWCENTVNIADVALLSVESTGYEQHGSAMFTNQYDAGAVRLLLEGKFLFNVVDMDSDFNAYKLIIMPDHVLVNEKLQAKLENFTAQGGKILASGKSGMDWQEQQFVMDFGVRHLGVNTFKPDYFRPSFELANLGHANFLIQAVGQRIELTEGGTELAKRVDPYFNRKAFQFSGHQHTPFTFRKEDESPGVVQTCNSIYIAWNVFEDYAVEGSLPVKELIHQCMRMLLTEPTLSTNLPAQGVVTLQHQTSQKRLVNHLLYASPVSRGQGVEIIEDILPVHDVKVDLHLPGKDIAGVYLAPQKTPLAYDIVDGHIQYTVPVLKGHQMVVLDLK
ncbi:alpha-amylase family protein [Paenibacillus pini]|uniref:Beta-galactosidase trimerisation domain-containing protein n=1 Tax=Paenibacillus pini JCM 16418 TaxID=1236976 RepID=W7YV77_9BACL|nr:beta-galactosidase trimerization domain-containing protein [Paenibacillus pini]GAF08511.1 hypothetical protein JCM16418_2592 [Paenibacillus pini JCM 16418]